MAKRDWGDDSRSVGDGVAETTDEGVMVSLELAEVGEWNCEEDVNEGGVR